MSKRFTYSRTVTTPGLGRDREIETFTADGFDSFEEAKKAVDKGIYDRKLEMAEESRKQQEKTEAEMTAAQRENHPDTNQSGNSSMRTGTTRPVPGV